MNEAVRCLAEREFGGLLNDDRKKLVEILRRQTLADGSGLHCFLEWLDMKEVDIFCVRNPKRDS